MICNDNFLPHLVFTNFQNTLKEFLHHIQEKDPNLKEFTITTTKGDEIYETCEDLDEDDVERNENNASKTLAHWFGTFQGEIVLNVFFYFYKEILKISNRIISLEQLRNIFYLMMKLHY